MYSTIGMIPQQFLGLVIWNYVNCLYAQCLIKRHTDINTNIWKRLIVFKHKINIRIISFSLEYLKPTMYKEMINIK